MKKCIIPLIAILSGCSSHYAILSTAIAPNAAPLRTDPIYLAAPEHPSITEQKAAPVIRSELCRNRFNLIDDPKRARWHLGWSVKTSIDMTDKQLTYSYGRAFLYGPAGAVQQSDPIPRTLETFILYRHLPDGRLDPVWEGSAMMTEKQWAVFGPAAVKVLLDKFGKDFHGKSNFNRRYVSDVAETGTCVIGKGPFAEEPG